MIYRQNIISMEGKQEEGHTTIIVNKHRERENDQRIIQQWRAARSHFFTHSILSKLNEVNMDEHQIQKIIGLFTNMNRNSDLNSTTRRQNLGQCEHDKLQHLYEQLHGIQELFNKRYKECLIITQIIQNKITNLKVINIQYQLKISKKYRQQHRYSILALELFKVIHDNKQLTQVIVKGVFVQHFEEFMKLINPQNILKERERINWFQDLNPSKQLKISINAELHFLMESKTNNDHLISCLLQFHRLFPWLSDIRLTVALQKWINFHNCTNNLQDLWKCIKKTLKKIKIQILGEDDQYLRQQYITNQEASAVRCLFGGLASLTEIDQLSFNKLKFQLSISDNNFLAFQQMLGALFENNPVTKLKLNICLNFPYISAAKSLRSIIYQNSSFRRSYNSINQLVRNNKCLQSIEYSKSKYYGRFHQERLALDQRIFHQLQTLIVSNTSFPNIKDLEYIHPLKIKYLHMQRSDAWHYEFSDNLAVVFPKLFHLVSLKLGSLDIGHQFICTISSTHLQELQIVSNNKITNKGLKEIDSKWPYLKYLTLISCNLTKNVWKMIELKGLLRLVADQSLLEQDKTALRYLKSKGIMVNHYC